jgi:hypothetical protein
MPIQPRCVLEILVETVGKPLDDPSISQETREQFVAALDKPDAPRDATGSPIGTYVLQCQVEGCDFPAVMRNGHTDTTKGIIKPEHVIQGARQDICKMGRTATLAVQIVEPHAT